MSIETFDIEELPDTSAALVCGADGSMEMHMPNMDDDVEIVFDSPTWRIGCFGILLASEEPEHVRLREKVMNLMMEYAE